MLVTYFINYIFYKFKEKNQTKQQKKFMDSHLEGRVSNATT